MNSYTTFFKTPPPLVLFPTRNPNPYVSSQGLSSRLTYLKCNYNNIRNSMHVVPTSHRLQRLVTEFESLTKPIDRVRRLLDYASRLPPLEESARCPCNRVSGCTTQVWLHVGIDDRGKVKFRADSDSEITKGFVSCLVWLLDGAEPEEVAKVKAEDLVAMNVGLYAGKAQSRVNTWHNVLVSMQDRTKSLVDGVGKAAAVSGSFCHRPR